MGRSKDFNEQEVLQKAMCLFWEKGYNGTSMQDLVDGLGISRSSLYDTFGDKHQLYLKALESYQQNYSAHLCGFVQSNLPAQAAIKQLLEMMVNELLADEQRKGCFVVNAGVELAGQDQQVTRLVTATEKHLEAAFNEIIVKGQQNGEIAKSLNAPSLARFFNNTIKGLQVSVKACNDRQLFDDIIATALMVLDSPSGQ